MSLSPEVAAAACYQRRGKFRAFFSDSQSFFQCADTGFRKQLPATHLLIHADTPNVGYSSYLYAGDGNRVYKINSEGIETFYTFEGLEVDYECEQGVNLNTTTKRYYIHALGRHIASVEIDPFGNQKTYYFHTDYLGSVRMFSDENVQVVWQKRYAPFGGSEEQSGTIKNTYQFTGKGWDEDAGLFYFNARWYDADVGRFISEDPLWGSTWDPQSLNRFAYVRNNPYRYTDPTGMFDVEKEVAEGNYGLEGPGYDGPPDHFSITPWGESFGDTNPGDSDGSGNYDPSNDTLFSDKDYGIPNPNDPPKWKPFGKLKIRVGDWRLIHTIPPPEALAGGIWPGSIDCVYFRDIFYSQPGYAIKPDTGWTRETREWTSTERGVGHGWAIPSDGLVHIRCDPPNTNR